MIPFCSRFWRQAYLGALRNLGLRGRGRGHGLFVLSIVRMSFEYDEPALRSLAPSLLFGKQRIRCS